VRLPLRPVAIVLFSVILCCATTFAQDSEKRVRMKDLPAAVLMTVQDQSKGATLRGLAKEVEDGKTFYEAELRVGGHNRDVLIDSSGQVVEIEEQVALASLPASVKAAVEKASGTGKILSVESITRNNTVEAYEAHVSKGGQKSEIKVAPDGQVITSAKEKGEKEEKAEGKKTPKTKKP
jgi:uncharacterized membrane protein YkoI